MNFSTRTKFVWRKRLNAKIGSANFELKKAPYIDLGISIDINSNSRLLFGSNFLQDVPPVAKNAKKIQNPSGLNFLSPPLRRKILLSVRQLLSRCLCSGGLLAVQSCALIARASDWRVASPLVAAAELLKVQSLKALLGGTVWVFHCYKPYWTQRMQCNFFLWQNCGTKVTNGIFFWYPKIRFQKIGNAILVYFCCA